MNRFREIGSKVGSFFEDMLATPAPKIDAEEVAALEAGIHRTSALKSLMQHPGWKYLQTDVELHMASMVEGLRGAQNLDEVRKFQVGLSEAEFWKDYVPTQVRNGEGDLQRLSDLRAQANGKETP